MRLFVVLLFFGFAVGFAQDAPASECAGDAKLCAIIKNMPEGFRQDGFEQGSFRLDAWLLPQLAQGGLELTLRFRYLETATDYYCPETRFMSFACENAAKDGDLYFQAELFQGPESYTWQGIMANASGEFPVSVSRIASESYFLQLPEDFGSTDASFELSLARVSTPETPLDAVATLTQPLYATSPQGLAFFLDLEPASFEAELRGDLRFMSTLQDERKKGVVQHLSDYVFSAGEKTASMSLFKRSGFNYVGSFDLDGSSFEVSLSMRRPDEVELMLGNAITLTPLPAEGVSLETNDAADAASGTTYYHRSFGLELEAIFEPSRLPSGTLFFQTYPSYNTANNESFQAILMNADERLGLDFQSFVRLGDIDNLYATLELPEQSIDVILKQDNFNRWLIILPNAASFDDLTLPLSRTRLAAGFEQRYVDERSRVVSVNNSALLGTWASTGIDYDLSLEVHPGDDPLVFEARYSFSREEGDNCVANAPLFENECRYTGSGSGSRSVDVLASAQDSSLYFVNLSGGDDGESLFRLEGDTLTLINGQASITFERQ